MTKRYKIVLLFFLTAFAFTACVTHQTCHYRGSNVSNTNLSGTYVCNQFVEDVPFPKNKIFR